MIALLSSLAGVLLLAALIVAIAAATNRAPLWVAVVLSIIASILMLGGVNVR